MAFLMAVLLEASRIAATLRVPPNGLELSCPAEAGNSPLLYAWLAGDSSAPESAARRVSFSELLGRPKSTLSM